MDPHKEALTIPESTHTNVESAGESAMPSISSELEAAGVHSEKSEHFDRINDELQRNNSVSLPNEGTSDPGLTTETQEHTVIIDTPTLEFTHKKSFLQEISSPFIQVFELVANGIEHFFKKPKFGSANSAEFNGDSSVEEVNRIRQQHAHGNI